MSQFIPLYKPQPLIQKKDNSGYQFLEQLNQTKQEIDKGNRLKNNAIRTALDKLSPSELAQKQNKELAESAYNSILEDLTNSMMYKLDEDGTYTSKRKEHSFWGPRIDDREYSMIMERIADADRMITEAKMEQAIADKWLNEFDKERSKPTGKIDNERTQAIFDAYYKEGIMPDDGQWMVYNGVGADSWTRDPKYYLKEQQRSAEGDMWVVRGAPQNYQRDVYYTEMQDPIKQKGMADEMLKNYQRGTPEGDKAVGRIASNLISSGVPEDQAMDRAVQELDRFSSTGKPSAVLADAAIEWGEVDMGYHRNIGKGYKVRREAEGSAGGAAGSVEPKERTYVAGDFRMDNFVDFVSLSQGDRRLNTQLPKGTIKVTNEKGNKVATKSFPELKQQGVYDVAGYDKNAGFIVVRSKETKDDRGRPVPPVDYLVPYRGNEYLIEKQTKKVAGGISKQENQFDNGYLD
jgi:hypothetical protein